MPKSLQDFLGYSIYFWSNEHLPVHVHVSKGNPQEDATKIEVTAEKVVLIHNKSQIPSEDLKKIIRYVEQNRAKVISKWYQHFGL